MIASWFRVALKVLHGFPIPALHNTAINSQHDGLRGPSLFQP